LRPPTFAKEDAMRLLLGVSAFFAPVVIVAVALINAAIR
jgi:hypothetical protein